MSRQSVQIPSFRYGLDTRRDVLVSQLGVLATCTNAFVNNGGELEKRQAFVDIFSATTYDFTGTFGLLAITKPTDYSGKYGFVTFADYAAASIANAGPD